MADYTTSIDIEAPPEVVFAHLVTPEAMVAWIGDHATLDPSPGGTFAIDIGGTPVRGEYVEVDPPRLVVVTWGVAGHPKLPAGSSRVEFRLTALDGGARTHLDLLHSGLPADEVPAHAQGWADCLTRLADAAPATR
jgi:uncharacterized protein YndB with AHSA1/START domain